MRRQRALLVLLPLALAACARAVAVQSADASRNYDVEITNQTGTTMVVSYNDGRGDAILGSVAPNRTERYIIASPASSTITIRGVAASGSRTSGPFQVTLTSGSTARVTLR